MSYTFKFTYGVILSIILFVYYMFFWEIWPNPNREVDCKAGQYTFRLLAKDCKTAFVEIE